LIRESIDERVWVFVEGEKKKKNKSMEGGYHGGNPTLGVVVL
jgi:hypothetical protein